MDKSTSREYQLYSAQTGQRLGRVFAESESVAVDAYAKTLGYADRWDMWNHGRWEYLSAAEVRHA